MTEVMVASSPSFGDDAPVTLMRHVRNDLTCILHVPHDFNVDMIHRCLALGVTVSQALPVLLPLHRTQSFLHRQGRDLQ